MDQNSTNGTGIDKRNWRERLGIGTRDMPKISEEFKGPPATAAATKPAVRAPQAVARPAPMAPRAVAAKPAAAPPPQEVPRSSGAPEALAEKLRAQRAAAEKLAQQRVNAARERAEAKSSSEPTLSIPRATAPSRAPVSDSPNLGQPAARPKFSFAEDDGNSQRRELGGGLDVNRPKPPRGLNPALTPGSLIPPRPALGGDRGVLRNPASSLRPDAPASYRPIDPASGYAQPAGRSAGYMAKRPYAAEAPDLGYGDRLPARAPAFDPKRRAAPAGPPFEPEDYADNGRGDPRLGRSIAARGRRQPADDEPDDVFEDDAPPQAPRRRASASEYHSAYREAEEGFDDDRRRSSGPWLLLLTLLIAGVATAGIVWYYTAYMKTTSTATTTTTTTSDSVPLVASPEQAAKTAPEAPAETVDTPAAASKKQIYDRIVGDREVLGGEMVPTEVTPIQPEAQPTDQSGVELIPQPSGTTGQGSEEQLPLPLPPPPGDNNTQGQLEQGSQQQTAAAAEPVVSEVKSAAEPQGSDSIASLLPVEETSNGGAADTKQAPPPDVEQPAADSSETITDSSPAAAGTSTGEAAATDASTSKPAKKKTAASKSTTKTKKPAADTTAALGAEPVVLVPPGEIAAPSQQAGDSAAASTAGQTTTQAAPRKKKTIFDLFKSGSEAPAEEKVVSIEPAPQEPPAETTVASLPAKKAEASAPASAATGYVVQLASFRSEAEARAEYDRLKFKYPSVIGSLPSRISQATVAGSARFRLGVGPLASQDEAAKVCGNLFAAGERDCLVRKQ